jgi:membrane protein YdbS with pleckstrin-like domain
MGRRALFWSGAVLIGLIVQQAAVSFFGPGANYWLGAAALVILLLSVPALLLGTRVEGMSRWRRWREARRRAMKHHRT